MESPAHYRRVGYIIVIETELKCNLVYMSSVLATRSLANYSPQWPPNVNTFITVLIDRTVCWLRVFMQCIIYKHASELGSLAQFLNYCNHLIQLFQTSDLIPNRFYRPRPLFQWGWQLHGWLELVITSGWIKQWALILDADTAGSNSGLRSFNLRKQCLLGLSGFGGKTLQWIWF